MSSDKESLGSGGYGEKDVEKGLKDTAHADVHTVDEAEKAHHIADAFAPLRWLTRGEQWMDKKLGVESAGIDRVKEEDKQPPSVRVPCTI